MKWNVYRQNFNEKEIEVFNVFDHAYFTKEVIGIKQANLSPEEFSDSLRRAALYYFWSKCEYETVITSWPPYVTPEEVYKLANEMAETPHFKYNVNLETSHKISIYDQLVINWDQFVKYVMEV